MFLLFWQYRNDGLPSRNHRVQIGRGTSRCGRNVAVFLVLSMAVLRLRLEYSLPSFPEHLYFEDILESDKHADL